MVWMSVQATLGQQLCSRLIEVLKVKERPLAMHDFAPKWQHRGSQGQREERSFGDMTHGIVLYFCLLTPMGSELPPSQLHRYFSHRRHDACSMQRLVSRLHDRTLCLHILIRYKYESQPRPPSFLPSENPSRIRFDSFSLTGVPSRFSVPPLPSLAAGVGVDGAESLVLLGIGVAGRC